MEISPADFEIIESSEQFLDPFMTLLDHVAKWFWKKDIKQWAPTSFNRNREKSVELVANGCLILAYKGSLLAGGCILTTINPGWPEDAGDALYLDSLAVARFAAGVDFGGKNLDASEAAAVRRGKARLGLDCWDGNEFLKSYYERHGFKKLASLSANGYIVRLFERSVGC